MATSRAILLANLQALKSEYSKELVKNILFSIYAIPSDVVNVHKILKETSKLNGYHLGLCLQYFARKGSAPDAAKLIEQAKKDNIPHHISWDTLLASAYAVDKDFKESIAIMRRTKLYTRGFPHLVKFLGRDKEGLELCLELFWKIGERQPIHGRDYISTMNQAATMGNIEAVMKIYDLMKTNGMLLDQNLVVGVYTVMMNMFKEKGKMEDCMILLTELERQNLTIPSTIYGILYEGFAKKGDTEKCKIIEKFIEEKNVKNHRMFTFLLQTYAKQGDIERCKKVLIDMKANMGITQYALAAFISLVVKTMDVEQALQIIHDMKENEGVELNIMVYCTMLLEYRKRDTEACERIFKEVEKEKGIKLSSHYFNLMLEFYANKGELKKLQEIEKRMRQHNVKGNSFTYSKIVLTYQKRGRIRECEEIYQNMKREGQVEDSCPLLEALITGFSLDKDIGKCLEYLEEIKYNNFEISRYIFGCLLYAVRDTKLSVEMSELIMEEYKQRGHKEDGLIMKRLMYIYAKAGEVENVRKTLIEMHKEKMKLEPKTKLVIMSLLGKKLLDDNLRRLLGITRSDT